MQTISSLRAKHLISPQELYVLLGDPSLCIFDIRGEIRPPSEPPPWYRAMKEEYLQAHIPQAFFVDWLNDITQPDAPVKLTIASKEQMRLFLSQRGVTMAHRIVIYDDDGGHTAARLWWTLRLYGFSNIQLLDGGWSRWLAEGYPTTNELPKQTPSTLELPPPSLQSLATTQEVLHAVQQKDAQLLDARSVELHTGKTTRGEKKGRIPGAYNVPYTELVEGPHKQWRSTQELTERFREAGLDPSQRTIVYCNAGVSACVDFFAMALMGYEDIAVYDGSWYAWEQTPEAPIETGPLEES